MSDAEYSLIAENIHKSFGKLDVLKGISLHAKLGDVVSIIGSSGSGKSTFLRCVNFLEMPDQGRVVLDGEEVIIRKDKNNKALGVDEKQIQRLRSQLGMVFQGFNLWSHMTVLQNLIEGPVQVLKVDKDEAEARAMDYLGKVGIADKANSYASQLSGGQQQRVAIARALSNDPSVILADEATGNLDSKSGGDILEIFDELNAEGKTLIMITHDEGMAVRTSRVIRLKDGEVAFDSCKGETI